MIKHSLKSFSATKSISRVKSNFTISCKFFTREIFRRNYFLKILLFVALTSLISSCSKDSSTEPIQPTNKGLFIINEGLYGQNNSEISYYDFQTQNVITSFYSSVNGKVLGDNANSMFIFDGKGYVAVDGSNKIEVIDLKTGTSLGSLDLGAQGSPREIYVLNNSRGFVTSFSTNNVIEFNPTTLTITQGIPVGEYPEGLVYSNNKLFVANSKLGKGNTISIIDLTSNRVIKTLEVGVNPRFVSLSNDAKVVVGCSGDFFDINSIGGYYFIDPVSLTKVDSILLTYHPQDFTITKERVMFYINDKGVGKINLQTKNVDTVFINGMQINDIYGIAYSLTYDDINEKLYVGNPKDFTQNGEVKIFDKNGNFVSKFGTKINPGALYIYR